jgi:hypothetical protein
MEGGLRGKGKCVGGRVTYGKSTPSAPTHSRGCGFPTVPPLLLPSHHLASSHSTLLV